ncbi:MAG: peptide chain release factor 1 [Clostridia bacterium]|jgi:peptide chain release factor 1|nr:peptide chain release factor 1 [Clostridia bacterium]
MLEKLQSLEDKYEELSRLLSDPEIIADQAEFQKHAKAHAALTDIVSAFREYKDTLKSIEGAKEILEEESDQELRELAEMELEEATARKGELEQELKVLLLPKDPNDDKNVIMEIRAGTGGEEAALFAGDLFRMYSRFVEGKNWSVDVLSQNATDIGGFKEIIFQVSGQGAYSQLKFESGVHRVQRVPATETQGRVHTSAATVAVLPEAEEVDVAIDPNELRIDVFCSSGPGGQSVNTTQSAVRVTHIPTGIVVSCQDEKSQHKNKDKALKILRARLMDKAVAEQQGELAEARKTMVGSGDRSERIRTYNFPQNRVTDHRINFTLHKLDMVMQGELGEIIEALVTTEQAEKLKNEV